MNFILAVDIGTTSTKGMAVTALGSVISTHQEFYPTHYPQPGYAEQNPDKIFEAVARVIQKIIQKTSSDQLAAIGFSAAMHSLMAVDEEGNAITPLIIWADTRSTAQAKQLKSLGVAQELYEVSGTPIHAMSPLCKLLWWKQYQPQIVSAASKFVSIKEFIIERLTGEYAIDFSTASATGLFDIHQLRWSEKVFDILQIPSGKFSRPVSIYHQISMDANGQKRLGLSSTPKIIVGASDGCSAQMGSQSLGAGELTITLGTSGAVRMARKYPVLDPNGAIFNYILDESTFVCGGATNNGTAVLNWYSEKFDPSTSKNLPAFVNEVELIEPGASGLIALPFLLGERAPMYDSNARGIFFGVAMHHTQKHFQRAILEGICFELKSIVQLVEQSNGIAKKILLSGGITRSTEWVQLLCDILGRSLIVSDEHDASSLGAAMIGFKSLGRELAWELPKSKIYHPNEKLTDVYTTHFEIFESLYKSTAPLFEKLAQLRK